MKSAILVAIAVLATSPALAQDYYDYAGKPTPGEVAIPYPNVPAPPGQHNVGLTSPTGLTVPLLPQVGPTKITARYANICVSSATRYTTDGVTTPTASVGQPLAAGACITLAGPQVLKNFLAISPGGTLDVEYFQ
jgi:hypothetical protein